MTDQTTSTTAADGRPFERRVRRWRAPTAKPGELVMRWGRLPNEAPGTCFAAGDGLSKRDMALLHYMLASKRMRWKEGAPTFEPSFLEELEARGYDLTTLRFSVRKKEAPNARGEASATAQG